jgi:hypothetical protein
MCTYWPFCRLFSRTHVLARMRVRASVTLATATAKRGVATVIQKQPTAAPPSWTCWYRRDSRHPWKQIGEADSEADAWRVALAYPLSGNKTIARPGTDPNTEKRSR